METGKNLRLAVGIGPHRYQKCVSLAMVMRDRYTPLQNRNLKAANSTVRMPGCRQNIGPSSKRFAGLREIVLEDREYLDDPIRLASFYGSAEVGTKDKCNTGASQLEVLQRSLYPWA